MSWLNSNTEFVNPPDWWDSFIKTNEAVYTQADRITKVDDPEFRLSQFKKLDPLFQNPIVDLPGIAKKIAYYCPGLQLVRVVPTETPLITQHYFDFHYNDFDNQNKTLQYITRFVINDLDLNNWLGNLNLSDYKRYYFCVEISKNPPTSAYDITTESTIKSFYPNPNDWKATQLLQLAEGTRFLFEFLGTTTQYGSAIFRVYRQNATFSEYSFIPAENSLPFNMDIFEALGGYFNGVEWVKRAWLLPPIGSSASPYPFVSNPAGFGMSYPDVQGLSAMEQTDTSFSSDIPFNIMNRKQADDWYPGLIGISMTSKAVQVGTTTVKTHLKLNELEDLQNITDKDLKEDITEVLINELNQKISKDIITSVKRLSFINRQYAPVARYNPKLPGGIQTAFDVDPIQMISIAPSNYIVRQHQIARKIFTKIQNASIWVYNRFKWGAPNYLITSYIMMDRLRIAALDTQQPITWIGSKQKESFLEDDRTLRHVGVFGKLDLWVDPWQASDDFTIYLGARPALNQPGLFFFPYKIAEALEYIPEGTQGWSLELRSRYAIGELGWFPESQFIAICCTDDIIDFI